jgi:hypothetical protein
MNNSKNPLRKMTNQNESNFSAGEAYLKVHLHVIHRYHDGYCSDCGDAYEEIETLYNYYIVPENLKDPVLGEFPTDAYNSEGLVSKEHPLMELLFEEWDIYGCHGSGVCGNYDTYIPVKIEYVKIAPAPQ